MEKKRIATLTLDDGRSIELPILSGTLGPDVIDIRNLGKLGIFTYDPAFFSTASCTSEITFIDGDAGLALLPRLSDRATGRAFRFPRSVLSAAERRIARCGSQGRIRAEGDGAHHGA